MSQQPRMDRIEPCRVSSAGLSESESHLEHQAALDATLFHAVGHVHELVFELDAGELRVRRLREP